MSFSDTLGRLRKQQHLSIRGLAKRVALTHTFINYLEKGERLPSVAQAIALARALDGDPREFALEALTERMIGVVQKELDTTLPDADRAGMRRILESRYGHVLQALIAQSTGRRNP